MFFKSVETTNQVYQVYFFCPDQKGWLGNK
jgi:hypothetical protein